MLHPGLIAKALDALIIGETSHWRSAIERHARSHYIRMRVGGGKRIQIPHLRVLWMIVFGRPNGEVSNACGDTDCINPYHYRDESDRQQAGWKVDIPREEESEWCEVQVTDAATRSDASLQDTLGLTNDFGCYYCGARFDPLADRNDVICPQCWTDRDQEMKEANSRD